MRKIAAVLLFILSPQLWGGGLFRSKSVAEIRRVKRVAQSFISAALCEILRVPQRYIVFITSLLFITTQNLVAQRTQIDSLLKLNASYTTTDNKKLLLLNTLAEKYLWVQIDTALNFSNEAITLAQKLNNKTELVIAYNNKAASLGHLVLLDEEEKVLQTALAISKAANNKNGIAETNINLCLLRKGDERKELIDEALLLFTQTGNKTGLGKAWFQAGNYMMFQNADSALKCINKAIDYFKVEGNDTWIGNSINTKGFIYLVLGELENSLSIANSLLETSLAQGNILNTISAYINIGNYYYMQADYAKAISNYLKALALAEQMKSVWTQSASFGNIGIIYQVIKDYDKALFYLIKAKEASAGTPENLISNFNSIGELFQLQGKYDSAQVYLLEALDIALKTNNQVRLPECYRPLAELAIVTKDFTKAFNYLNLLVSSENKEWVAFHKHYYHYLFALAVKNAPDSILLKNKITLSERKSITLNNLLESYNLFKGQPIEYENKDILLELSRTYEEQGNTPKAYYHFKEYVNVIDSIAKTDNLNTIASLQIQYDSEKQQQQITLLQKDKALHQTEIQKQKTQRNILIAASILVLVLIGFIVNRYQIKSKATAEIEKTYNHLLQTQQQLVQSGKLAALGKMTADVGSRIKEPIEKVKTLSPQGTLLANEYENATATRKTEILQQLKINLTEINTNGIEANEIVKDVLMQTRKQTA